MRMKFLMVNLLATVAVFANVISARAYSFKDFVEDVQSDTAKMYHGGHPEMVTGTYFDFMAPGNSKTKFVGGFNGLAWKCFVVQPAFVYTPDRANRTGEVSVFLSLKPAAIPIGQGYQLGALFDSSLATSQKSFLYNFTIGLGASFHLLGQIDDSESSVGFGPFAAYQF